MPLFINGVECKKYQGGTGLVSCEPFFGEPVSFILTKKTWTLDVVAGTLDQAYILSKIQDGTFVPFLNAEDFTENTGEPTRKDYTSGKRKTIRNANPDYTFEFDNGIGFHTKTYTYNGSQWNVIFIDAVGNWMLQSNISRTTLLGFDSDDLNIRTYRQKKGDDSAATMVDVHLGDTESFNRNMVLITVEDVGMNVNSELFGVVDVNIKVVSASVANGIVVDVVSSNNSKTGILALLLGNFEIFNVTDGVLTNVTTAVASTSVLGRYTLTSAAVAPGSGDVIQVATKGYALGQATLLAGSTQFYKGQSAIFTMTS